MAWSVDAAGEPRRDSMPYSVQARAESLVAGESHREREGRFEVIRPLSGCRSYNIMLGTIFANENGNSYQMRRMG